MESEKLDRASDSVLYYLSTDNPVLKKVPTENVVSVPVESVSTRKGGVPFTALHAQHLGEAWGYEFLGEVKNSSRLYWRFCRRDAPKVDVIGGPSRNIVRLSPGARREAVRVKEECGVDVMDPEACYEVERAAGEVAAGGFNGWFGANSLFALGMFIGFSGFMFQGPLAVSLPLACVGVAVAALGIRPARKAHRRRKDYKVNHLPKVEAVRRVVRVAEDEFRAGWRPDVAAQHGS